MTHGWQSESTEGLKGDWSLSLFLSLLLSFSLFLWLSTYLPTDLSIYLSIYLSISISIYHIYLSNYLPIYRSIYPSIHLSIYLSIYPSIYLSLSLSIYLPVYLQAWKPCHSTRLLHFSKLTTSKTQHFCETSSFLKLTTSKTKQFCETSSFFEVDHIKNKAELTASYQCVLRFAIFPVHLSKVLRLPRKSDAKSNEVLHLSRKIISANLKIWCSKMQPLSGNQRPDLLTSLMNMSFVLRLPREMHLWRSSSNGPRPPSLLDMLQNPHVFLTFDKVHNPLRLPRESTSERPKVLRARQFFALLTLKCASRHNGVHFFDIATSKSGSKLVCFVHFDFETCFAPQQRAIFHLSSGQMAPHPPL